MGNSGDSAPTACTVFPSPISSARIEPRRWYLPGRHEISRQDPQPDPLRAAQAAGTTTFPDWWPLNRRQRSCTADAIRHRAGTATVGNLKEQGVRLNAHLKQAHQLKTSQFTPSRWYIRSAWSSRKTHSAALSGHFPPSCTPGPVTFRLRLKPNRAAATLRGGASAPARKGHRSSQQERVRTSFKAVLGGRLGLTASSNGGRHWNR